MRRETRPDRNTVCRTAMVIVTMMALSVSAVRIVGQQGLGNGGAPPPLLAPPIRPLADTYLQWPLLESARQYGIIDGRHLHTYVEELAEISRRSRDTGNQWWGRITGTAAHDLRSNGKRAATPAPW